MTAFQIACTTCQARLKVRDESAIGQILACPKCGGMVLVERPASAPWESSTSVPVSASQQVTIDEPMRPAEFGEYDSQEYASAEAIGTTAANPSPGQSPQSAAGPEIAARPDEWLSRESRQARQWLLTGAALVVGVLLAVLFVGYLVSRPARDSQSVASSEGSPAATSASEQGSTPSADTEKSPADVATDAAVPPSPPEPAPLEPAPIDPPPVEPGPVDAAPSGPGPIEPAPGEAAAVEPAPAPGDPEIRSPVSVDGAPDDGAPTTEPPAVDPTAPVAPHLASPFDNPLDLRPADGAGAPSGVMDLEAILRGGEPTPTPPSPVNDPFGETSYDRLLGQVAPARRPNPRVVDVAARMAEKYPAVELNGVTLAALARFVTELTTIPVTLDPAAIAELQVSPETPIKLPALKEVTAEQLLRAAVTPLGLGVSLRGDQLRIGFADAESLGEAVLKADDLATDDASRAELAALITAVVAPGSWAPAGPGTLAWNGDGQLKLGQRKEALFGVLSLLERLRLARGLTLQSGLPPERFATGTRRAAALEKLAKPVRLLVRQHTPLVEVLDELSRRGGIRVLVDWEAVAPEGWHPGADVTLVVDNEPLGRALRALVAPMNLDYYVATPDYVVITSREGIAQRLDVELYPIADLTPGEIDVERVLATVRAGIGDRHFVEGGGRGVVRLDLPSRTLIAALPQPQQRELQLFLDQRRVR